MIPFSEPAPLWELSQQSSFPLTSDEDFFALLQKHYPPQQTNTFFNPASGFTPTGINPQTVNQYAINGVGPSSEGSSSPSPPNPNSYLDHEESNKKRRTSPQDSDEDQPSHKAQHTLNDKDKRANSRRQSTGKEKDEARLNKRKEQNRAAQRAFRERKEKHVRDLEDQVAALEAKNEAAQSENENLRDLLGRLQKENMTLKQSSFTFSVPKNAGSSSDPAFFGSNMGASSSTSSPPMGQNSFDFNSLTTLDPNMLSLLDDVPQGGNMNVDFGVFGSSPFTTIASNPDYMSFASYFDSNPPAPQNNPGSFDLNSMTSWTGNSPSQNNPTQLTDLFGGFDNTMEFPPFGSTPSLSTSSISPVSHANLDTPPMKHSPPSARAASESTENPCSGGICPTTKEEMAVHVKDPSPFAPSPNLTVAQNEGTDGPMILCQGSSFPRTQLSDKNVPLLEVWRNITGNPIYRDIDINSLCEEFSCKAKCDGTKVVLEPEVVDGIMDTLAQRIEEPRATTPTRH